MRAEDVAVTVKKDLMEGTASYSDSFKYTTPHIHRHPNQNDRADDSLRAAKGIMMGVLLSIPFWMLILFLIFK